MLAKTIVRMYRQEIGGCGGVKVNRGKTEALHTVITAGNGVTIRVGKRCT
ncbi:hypothetical protein O2313_08290 [Bacillus amyloliquefaciens]|nr:hypothetical protein [Bacillus amyloliquefaciens]MCZ4247517.1 hypothetical protein [Bacillus amyloliquefaciens]